MVTDYQSGDKVHHRSGTGPVMGVIGVAPDGRVICSWTDEAERDFVQVALFRAVVLDHEPPRFSPDDVIAAADRCLAARMRVQ